MGSLIRGHNFREWASILTSLFVMCALVIFGGPDFVVLGLLVIGFIAATAWAPIFAVTAVLFSLSFIPYWFGIQLLGYVPVVSVVIIVALPGLVIGLVARKIRIQFNIWDTVLVVIVLLVALLAITGSAMYGHAFVALAQWVPAYVFGRLAAVQVLRESLFRVVSLVFAVVAALSLVEFAASWNPYAATVPNTAQYETIGSLQDRGGVTRSEWAFGHSIALGNSLALAIPLAIAAPMRPVLRAALLMLLVLGVVVTFSRSAMVTAALAAVLALWSSRAGLSLRARLGFLAAGILAILIAIPTLDSVFGNATAETARSASHRITLINMLDDLVLFGTANGYTESGGVFNWNGVISIDNAYIRIGVNFGWVVALLLTVSSLLFIVRAVSRSSSVPEIALAAVVPALMTAALLTQFGILVWIYVGFAAAMSTKSGMVTVSTKNSDATARPVAGRIYLMER